MAEHLACKDPIYAFSKETKPTKIVDPLLTARSVVPKWLLDAYKVNIFQ